jgi:hypothetical protein
MQIISFLIAFMFFGFAAQTLRRSGAHRIGVSQYDLDLISAKADNHDVPLMHDGDAELRCIVRSPLPRKMN